MADRQKAYCPDCKRTHHLPDGQRHIGGTFRGIVPVTRCPRCLRIFQEDIKTGKRTPGLHNVDGVVYAQ